MSNLVKQEVRNSPAYKVKRILWYLFRKPSVLLCMAWDYMVPFFSDRFFLTIKFRLHVGYWHDLKNPKTYNEKLQWLKLYDKHPEYTNMVDKIEAKEYVKRRIGGGTLFQH